MNKIQIHMVRRIGEIHSSLTITVEIQQGTSQENAEKSLHHLMEVRYHGWEMVEFESV